MDLVVAAAAPDVVGSGAALDQVVAGVLALDLVGARARRPPGPSEVCSSPYILSSPGPPLSVSLPAPPTISSPLSRNCGVPGGAVCPVGHAGDVVAAVHLVDAAVAEQLVGFGSAVDQVVERTAVQLVLALAAVEPVVALLAQVGGVVVTPGLVGAVADVDGVVPGVASTVSSPDPLTKLSWPAPSLASTRAVNGQVLDGRRRDRLIRTSRRPGTGRSRRPRRSP